MYVSFEKPDDCWWVCQIVKPVLMQSVFNIFTFLLFQNILAGFVFSDTLNICCLYEIEHLIPKPKDG